MPLEGLRQKLKTENWPLDFSSEHVKSLMILTKVGTVE